MRFIFGDIDPAEFTVPQPTLDDASFGSILQIVFGIAGAVCVLMIMLGSLKYVISRGEPDAVAKAKNTIIYSLVGLVVAAAAFSIVTFVVSNV